ncbi:hypothetical protein CEXT_9751 [Caerostris extrusa]|uniref:Uncharacterized protein n=1 Tax=Caerostris extrusa TaxID=172846 RepID=A0AAV4TL06_CAEEX|nr:hypothetical protein CEXT_9751 [Caerostris extrusa]
MEDKSRRLFSRIEANIEEMEESISEIRKRHNRILSSPFHDEEDFHELDRLMAKIQSSSANTWSLLKGILLLCAIFTTSGNDFQPRTSFIFRPEMLIDNQAIHLKFKMNFSGGIMCP